MYPFLATTTLYWIATNTFTADPALIRKSFILNSYKVVSNSLCLSAVCCQCRLPSVLWCCWLGGRKGIRPVNNWMVRCWHGYLSETRCRLAYGPADATATRCLLLQIGFAFLVPQQTMMDVRTNLATRRPHTGRMTCLSFRRTGHLYRLTLSTENIKQILAIRLEHSTANI